MTHFRSLVIAFGLIILMPLNAQQPDPLRSSDPLAQYQWVDSVYKSLSVNEKIGQLFFPMLYPTQGEAYFETQLKAFEEQQWGGIIFSTGTPDRQSRWINALQRKAKIPLLVSLDAEWGAAMRLDSVLAYPWNMTLGAIKNDTIIEAIGYRMGRQLKKLGVHLNYAPVLDVNTNPLNPIIGNRSFGEDPKRVAQKGIAIMNGLHKAGLMTSGKHFPGHGDTAQDSHKTLPTVNFDRQRIEEKELYPYRELIAAGLSSVMVAHLSIPSIDPSGKPLSISKSAVTDLLKKQMGFNGLIVTDAMNMSGVANYKGIKNADLEAFLAGNDLLLISVDIPKSLKVFMRAYKRGIITEERLAHSVKKILKAKYKAGLHKYTPIDRNIALQELSTAKDTMLVARAMENAITVVNNPNKLLPLNTKKSYGLLTLGPASSDAFTKHLQLYGNIIQLNGSSIEELQPQLKELEGLIVSYHTSATNPYKKATLTASEKNLIVQLGKRLPLHLNVFTKPYILKDLEGVTDDMAVMVSYQNTSIAQQISADIMWGVSAAQGTLPVSASKDYPLGTGISIPAQQRLGYATPAMQGFDTARFKKIETFAQVVLDSAMTPGLQMLVARRGKIIFHKSFGYHTYEKKQAVRNSDIYDLASLTKILGTMPMVLKAYDDKKFNLNSSVGTLIPDWKKTNKKALSARAVLSHYAQLVPFIPFYKSTLDKRGKPRRRYYRSSPSSKFKVRVTDKLFLRSSFPKKMYDEIKKSNLRDTLEYKYSDVAFYTMKYFLEGTYHSPLDSLVHKNFYAPLGLKNTLFNAADRISLSRIIPSEKDTFFRHQKLQGYVHDEGAAMLGGVGGHAGLFSNSYEVAVLMQLYLQKGIYNGKRYFNAKTFDVFNVCYYCESDNRRGVGFDKPQTSGRGSTCGCVSKESFGHFGFTGTYTWADPEKEIVFVFLSNRTYPTRDNNLLGDHDIRTRMQGLIYEALMD